MIDQELHLFQNLIKENFTGIGPDKARNATKNNRKGKENLSWTNVAARPT